MVTKINEIGYWSGLAAFSAVVSYDTVQILQVVGVLQFPVDEILIYATSLCIVVPFMLEMISFHHLTAKDKQFWTHTSLIFTIIYAVFVIANYVVQLATVIPFKLNNTTECYSCSRTNSSLNVLELRRDWLYFDGLGNLVFHSRAKQIRF